MNRYDLFLYSVFLVVYVFIGWLAPLSTIDGFDNRWLNVAAFHLFTACLVWFLFAVGYAAGKSKNFRGN